MERPKQTKKLPGFYIALSCCVIAVGMAGFLSQKANSPQTNETDLSLQANNEDKPVLAEHTLELSDNDNEITEDTSHNDTNDTVDAPSSSSNAKEAASIEDYAIDNPDVEAASVIINAQGSNIMNAPVPSSEILEGFSGDKLQYNEVFNDWRAHNGIDIAADTGCSVCAAADGTVTEVGAGSLGNYITIDHGNGISAVYAQLNDINAAVGDHIKSGSVIGTVAPSKGETVTESHLHYEIIKNGKYVDPQEY